MSHFTEGGQTQLHKLRMMRQVVSITLLASLLLGLICFLALVFWHHTWQELFVFPAYGWSWLRLYHLQFLPRGFLDSVWYPYPKGGFQEFPCWGILNHPWFTKTLVTLQTSLLAKAIQAGCFSFLSALAISLFWIWRGKKRRMARSLKGPSLATPSQLRALIRKRGASSIKLAGIQLPKGSETEHLMITGTTGTGKSNALHHLIQQIRAQQQPAIIVDVTGGLVSRFYEPARDVLLNPLDSRSQAWNLWRECQEVHDYDELSESLIPFHSHDPFWTQSARQLFSVAASELAKKPKPSLEALLGYCLTKDFKTVQRFFKNTLASSFVSPEAEKMALSIRAMLASNFKCLSLLKDTRDGFAIKEWVTQQTSNPQGACLFLSSLTTQRETLKPLLSAWLSLAVKATLALPENPKRRIWFLIDELAALHKLPSLVHALSELRKYGGCCVICFQDLSQLDEIYGIHATRSISALTGTKLIFRTADPAVAERLSKILGEQEVVEPAESLSFGAHQMREGVSLSDQRRVKPLVTASELMQLPNLEGYLKVPGAFPVVKVRFSYLRIEKKRG